MNTENDNRLKMGLYRHFKGNQYQVLGVAKHSETQENMVVYRCLYGDFGLWVRPQDEFCSSVERDGQTLLRFEWMGPADPQDELTL